MSQKKLVMLVIMDGFGIRKETDGNAIAAAKKPNLDKLFAKYPHTLIGASGEAVGLPDGQMGNSEVGHLNIGAGRIVFQSLTRVNIACREHKLDTMPAIDNAIKHAINNNSTLHIMGLMSDGGVHSHINHIIYLMNKAIERGVKKVVVHSFLDGRDVPPTSAKQYLTQLSEAREKGVELGVVCGRYYAMDRDKNYDRTQLAYNALVYGDAPVKGLLEGIDESYAEDVTDEFVKPYIVTKGSNIKENDSVIFANFRPDRAIQISTAITNPKATALTRYEEFKNICFVSMMLYSENVKGLVNFGVQKLDNMYGDVISERGLTQLRIAETEKYAHVTYFFDGGVDKELKGETRILIPSPKVATFDLKPEMSAYEVTDKVVEAINKRINDKKHFTILAVAEGAISKDDAQLTKKQYKAKVASRRYPSVSYEIADQIQEKCGVEVRVAVPGHTQRGGSPCPYDRVLCTRLGSAAAKAIMDGKFGCMIAMINNKTKCVPLGEVAGKLKTVDPDSQMIQEAKRIGISFGD